jgi:RNase adaptor protein for sRNA GlmZ degradation
MSGHGGGYVFDCRALPNPGREERFRDFTGKDEAIASYLKGDPAVTGFLADAESLVSRSVENYISRGFSHLVVSFGCTGGRHRSVYCAESLAERLKRRFPQADVSVVHLMI